MLGHRNAALLLHSISAHDRERLLTQISAKDKEVLVDCLTELNALGIPSDRSFLRNFIAANPSTTEGASAIIVARNRLRDASAKEMLVILTREPNCLVRQVLALGQQPWHEEFLVALPTYRREILSSSIESATTVGDKMAESLYFHVASRLDNIETVGAVNRNMKQSNGVLSKLQSVFQRLLTSTRFAARP
jgi:hypothetical protein